jgi:hypothetical protein
VQPSPPDGNPTICPCRDWSSHNIESSTFARITYSPGSRSPSSSTAGRGMQSSAARQPGALCTWLEISCSQMVAGPGATIFVATFVGHCGRYQQQIGTHTPPPARTLPVHIDHLVLLVSTGECKSQPRIIIEQIATETATATLPSKCRWAMSKRTAMEGFTTPARGEASIKRTPSNTPGAFGGSGGFRVSALFYHQLVAEW